MSSLKAFLEPLFETYHTPKLLSSDPLEFVHRYKDPQDQEVVALICALLAYGNVKQIRSSAASFLKRISAFGEPKEFVTRLKNPTFRKKADRAFEGFVHRFNPAPDWLDLLQLLAESWRRHGSLGAHFCSFLEPSAQNIGLALAGLTSEWKERLRSGSHGSHANDSVFFLLTSPQDRSTCKRWCMLLRWMGRKDALDPGLWQAYGLRPDQLVLPLDTHTSRISQYLGLTSRRTLGWQAALEITSELKKVDPQDPTRYDFALSRLGILDLCRRVYRKEICNQCQLLPVCQFAKKHSPSPLVSMRS